MVVHDARFHADDIFAVATMQIYLKGKLTVIRTRDEKIIEKADIVADVGGIYDEKTDRFDHHQKGGAGVRTNGVPYASFGLVWKKYGESLSSSKKVADRVEKHLVYSIDAADNGINVFEQNNPEVFPYLIQQVFRSISPTWKEDNSLLDQKFFECVDMAKKILEREIIHAQDYISAEEKLENIYNSSPDQKILILDDRYPWEEILVDYPKTLIIVAPRPAGNWKAEVTFLSKGSMERKMYFPQTWAGLRDEEMAKVSGVPDAIFCHNGRFIAVAKSKEGAIALAQKSLTNKE